MCYKKLKHQKKRVFLTKSTVLDRWVYIKTDEVAVEGLYFVGGFVWLFGIIPLVYWSDSLVIAR